MTERSVRDWEKELGAREIWLECINELNDRIEFLEQQSNTKTQTIQRCDTCLHWVPNSRSLTGKCRILKLKEGVIVHDLEQNIGKFMTTAGFGCPHWEEKGRG